MLLRKPLRKTLQNHQMTLPSESRWFMVNYFDSETILAHFLILNGKEFVNFNIWCICFFLSRNCWLYRLVPGFWICRWDSLQRYWCRLSSLCFNEGRRDKGQDRRHEMADLLGHFCSFLRRWVLLALYHQDYPLLLAPEMYFLCLVYGSDREQRKCRHVPESHPTLFFEASIRFVHDLNLRSKLANMIFCLILAVDDIINNTTDKLKKGAEEIFKKGN